MWLRKLDSFSALMGFPFIQKGKASWGLSSRDSPGSHREPSGKRWVGSVAPLGPACSVLKDLLCAVIALSSCGPLLPPRPVEGHTSLPREGQMEAVLARLVSLHHHSVPEMPFQGARAVGGTSAKFGGSSHFWMKMKKSYQSIGYS